MRRFIIGIGACGYGDREVLPSAGCKPENQESQWCNLVQVQQGENRGSLGGVGGGGVCVSPRGLAGFGCKSQDLKA